MANQIQTIIEPTVDEKQVRMYNTRVVFAAMKG